MIITTAHLYSVPTLNGKNGYCANIARIWCEQNNISWSQFVFHGVESDILLATNDAFAIQVVQHALSLEAASGQ